jgi:hypothetical protein
MIGLLAAAALAAAPAPAPAPLNIGETVTLEAVGAQRSVNIILPPDYAAEPELCWPETFNRIATSTYPTTSIPHSIVLNT